MPKYDQLALKRRLAETGGHNCAAIAREFGVHRSYVQQVWRGKWLKSVPWPDGFTPKSQQQKTKQPVDTTPLNPIDAEIRGLKAEILHLKDELRIERKQSIEGLKTEGLFKSMIDCLEKEIKPLSTPPAVRRLKTTPSIEEHCVMHLSDGHHDQIILPHECGGLEAYNFTVSCARAEKYVNTVLKWTQQTLAPQFRFPVLNILSYGDHTSGEIHGHVPRSAFKNQFKNCFAIGQLHALMIRDLAPHFPQINVVYVPGNHGRRSNKKDYYGAHDNWDYLVAEVARLHCTELKNVEFLIPDAFSINLDINGVGFNIAHGDDVRGSLGIPYYGLQRRQRNMQAIAHAQEGPRIRYYCVGHFHKPGSLGDGDGEILVNGPWVATDSYAYNRFAGYTEPSQWIHGVQPDKGITWRLKVNLKGPTQPTRYKVTV